MREPGLEPTNQPQDEKPLRPFGMYQRGISVTTQQTVTSSGVVKIPKTAATGPLSPTDMSTLPRRAGPQPPTPSIDAGRHRPRSASPRPKQVA